MWANLIFCSSFSSPRACRDNLGNLTFNNNWRPIWWWWCNFCAYPKMHLDLMNTWGLIFSVNAYMSDVWFWICTRFSIIQLSTQQNSYSISHLQGTVTIQWLHSDDEVTVRPRHRDYWTVTTSDTHVIKYPLPWSLCRNMSTRHLVGNCMVTAWENTRYLLDTVTV